MIKPFSLKKILIVMATLSHTFASIQSKNLGQLSLLPGLTARLYNTSLISGDDYDHHPQYLESKQFLTDGGRLLSQTVITSVKADWIKDEKNCMFGLYRDEHDVILELRGYIKAPADGVFDIYAGLVATFDPDGNYIPHFEAGYWIIKNAISLNETANGFICSYEETDDRNYSQMDPETACNDICSPMGSEQFAFFVEDQYYPIVFYTYFSGDVLVNDWIFQVDDDVYPFDEYIYYDPNDDFAANDANLDAGFPEICPQFHKEIFIPQYFVEESAIHVDECPLPSIPSSFLPSSMPSTVSSSVVESSDSASSFSTILSISTPSSSSDLSSSVPPSSIESSSYIVPSSSISSSVTLSSSHESISSVPSDSKQSCTNSQFSSFKSHSSFSSAVSSSSSSISQVSSDNHSIPSSTESKIPPVSISRQSGGSESGTVSDTSTSSHILPNSSLKASPFTSTGGKSIYTANSASSNTVNHIQTSRPIISTSPSNVSSDTSENSDGFSTVIMTTSETDTIATTTCPETEHMRSRYTAHSSLVFSNPQSEPTRSETTIFTTQATPTNGMHKTTVGPGGPTITYSKGARVSEAENSFRSANQTEHAESAVTTDLSTSGVLVSNGLRTTAVVQTFSDKGHLSRYQPLLLGIAILMTFI